MPIFEIQDPQGRTLEIDGDHEPTADELRKIFSQAFPTEEPAAPAPSPAQAPAAATQEEPLTKSWIPEFLLPQERLATPPADRWDTRPLLNVAATPQYQLLEVAAKANIPGTRLAKAAIDPGKALFEGFTSPENLAVIPAGIAAPEIVGPAFAAMAIPSVVQGAKNAYAGFKAGNLEQAVGGASEAITSGATAALGLAGLRARPAGEATALAYPPEAIEIPPSAAAMLPRAAAEIAIPPKFRTVEQEARRAAIKAARPVVPETAAEAERGLSVIEEIRAKGADTKEKIRALFPQLSRETAAKLRDQAFPKAKIPDNLSRTDVDRLFLEKLNEQSNQEIQDASRQQEAAKVHGDVPPQSVEGVRQVPVEEGGRGVQPQAERRVSQEAKAQPAVEDLAPEVVGFESNDSIVQRTAPGAERDAAFANRAKALKQVALTLKPGDVIVTDDGGRLVVDQVMKDGTIFAYKEGSKSKGGQVGLSPDYRIERQSKPAVEDLKVGESRPMTPVREIALEQQRQAGWNPNWPFVPADLMQADFRELIRQDPTLSDAEKAQVFSAGEKLGVVPKEEIKPAPAAPEQAPPTEAPTTAAVSAAKEGVGETAPSPSAISEATTKPESSQVNRKIPIIQIEGRIYQGITHADAYNKALKAGEKLEASPDAIAKAEALGIELPKPNWEGGWLVNGKPVFGEGEAPIPETTVWHQTAPENAPSIRSEGYRESKTGFLGPGVYVATTPKIISSKLVGKPAVTMESTVTGKLLKISGDAPNVPLEILRQLMGDEEGGRFYDAHHNEVWSETTPNWKYLRKLAEDRGYSGYSQSDVGYDRVLVFDPKNVKPKPLGGTETQPTGLESIPENTEPIPELRAFEYHPGDFQRGLPVYSSPNARSELARRFGIPNEVGNRPPGSKENYRLFVNKQGRPIALWRERQTSPEPLGGTEVKPTAEPTPTPPAQVEGGGALPAVRKFTASEERARQSGKQRRVGMDYGFAMGEAASSSLGEMSRERLIEIRDALEWFVGTKFERPPDPKADMLANRMGTVALLEKVNRQLAKFIDVEATVEPSSKLLAQGEGGGAPERPAKSKRQGVERPEDIIDIIEQHVGKIRRKSAAKPGTEGYYTPEFVDLQKSGASRKLFSDVGQSPDEALDTLRRAGFVGSEATVGDLEVAMRNANARRRAVYRGETPEVQADKFQTAISKQGKKKSSHVVSVGDLSVGDKFRIGGEDFEVTSIDPDTGEVTVKDGRKFGYQTIPDGADLPVEKGSLDVKPKVPVLTEEDFALNAPESVEAQKARLAKEAADAKAKADREKMEAAAAKPLVGSQGSIGQGEMFGGGDLLSGPSMSVGPGAAAAGEPGSYSAIEQLSDRLRTVPSTAKANPLSWREKAADLMTAGRSAFAKVVGRARAVSETMKEAGRGIRDVNDTERAVGVLDRELQTSSGESRNLGKVMERTYKDANMRRAAALYIDAGGNVQQFRDALAHGLPENTRPEVRRAIETVANMPEEGKALADFLREYYGIREKDAVSADIFKEGLEDYFTHVWKREASMPDKLRMAITTGKVNTYWQFARQRKLSTFLEGIMEGKTPELDPAKVVPYYNFTLDRAIASRAFIRRLSDLKMSDGRDALAPTGTRMEVERGTADETSFIRPRAKPESIGDYRSVDHPALRKWKWAGTNEAGNPTFYQSDLLVHPELYERLARIMERSRLTPAKVTRAALRVGSEMKSAKFGLASTFHQIHVGLHAAFHWADPFMLKTKPWVQPDGLINFRHPFVQDAIEKGHLKVAADPHELNLMSEGILNHGALIHKIPFVGPWSRVYSEWLFTNYIPKLKLATYEAALPRNLKHFAGKLTEEQVKARVGDAVNSAYGELNRLFLGKYGRDPRFQRALQLGFLAPDFGEARLRFVGKALTKAGYEERLALVTMFTTLYTTARIANYLSHGNPEWDWKKAFSVKAGDHWFSVRSVIGDVDHALADFVQFATVRLSPASRTILEVFSKRDAKGQKRTGSEQVGDFMRQFLPISLQGVAEPERAMWESFSGAMGLSARKENAEQEVRTMVREWMKKSRDPAIQARIARIEKETFAPSEYAGLRRKLKDHDNEGAQAEYKKLRKTKTPQMIETAMRPTRPLAGSYKIELEFRRSMTPAQRSIYNRAKREREQQYERFLTLSR